jgi:hypothetical protein
MGVILLAKTLPFSAGQGLKVAFYYSLTIIALKILGQSHPLSPVA